MFLACYWPFCLQALGVLAQLEAAKFGRRVASILPLLAASLHKGVQVMDSQHEVTDAGGEDESAAAGWQEVYACLLLLERIAAVVPTQVSDRLHIRHMAVHHLCDLPVHCSVC